MAASFIIAVTAHREVGGMGQRGEQRQQPVVAGLSHLRPIASFKCAPGPFATIGLLERCNGFRAWGEVGEPEVVEVPVGVLGFRHASWRPADRAKTKAFAR